MCQALRQLCEVFQRLESLAHRECERGAQLVAHGQTGFVKPFRSDDFIRLQLTDLISTQTEPAGEDVRGMLPESW